MTTPQLEQDEPRVTGSPEAIWLVYGDIDRDDTHANLCASGEVTWSDTAQYPADVRYTRTDLVAERVRAAVAAERERCAKLCEGRMTYWQRDDIRRYEDECCAAAIRGA